MTSSLCPREIISNLLLGIKWLLRDAVEISGKSEFLGADLMFPILVLALVHANVPTMHLILHFLQSFSAVDNYGEAAYYVTCLEAAVLFIDRLDPPPQDVIDESDAFRDLPLMNTDDNDDGKDEEGDEDTSNNDDEIDDNDIETEAGDTCKLVKEGTSPRDDEKSIQKLGEWIRDQQTMEETITILQQQGWML